MKVQELLANIKNNDFNLQRGLQVKKYLPIELKKTIAQSIIYDCTDNESGATKVDSVQRYMSYVRYMITMHTNLEYTDEDYDALCSTECGETNLLNAIMDCFEGDAKECSRILNLMMDDYMQEMTIEFTVAKFLNGLNNSISNLADGINQKIDGFNVDSLKDVDINNLNTFLQNYIK